MIDPKQCPYCRVYWRPVKRNEVTCGRPRCRKLRKGDVAYRQRKEFMKLERARIASEGREPGKKYRCVMCNDVFVCTKETHIMCGKEECRKKRKSWIASQMRKVTPTTAIRRRSVVDTDESPS